MPPLRIPPPEILERRGRVLGLLDALLEPDEDVRTFSFHEAWDPARGERVSEARSGEGDHLFLWLGPEGALLRGKSAAHPSAPAEELFRGLPAALGVARDEPAFQLGGDSFAAWWPEGGEGWAWAVEPASGGAADLLFAHLGKGRELSTWVREAHERRWTAKALEPLLAGEPLTPARLAALERSLEWRTALAEATRLGIPVDPAGAPEPPARSAGMEEDRAPSQAEGEFRVLRVGDEVMLAIGGRVKLRVTDRSAYLRALEAVRAVLGGG